MTEPSPSTSLAPVATTAAIEPTPNSTSRSTTATPVSTNTTTLPAGWSLVDADTLIDISDVDLPDGYVTEQGNRMTGEPRTRTIRADLLDFATLVRERHPALADRLSWTLQTIPWAVCVLGPSLDGGWAGFVDQVQLHVDATAAAVPLASTRVGFDASYNPIFEAVPSDWIAPSTANNDPALADVQSMAAEMFCPIAGPRRGDPANHLRGWSPDGDGEIEERHFQVLPYWVHRSSGGDIDMQNVSAIGGAYAAVAAVPELAGWTAASVRLIVDGFSGCQQSGGVFYGQVAVTPMPPDRWSEAGYQGDLLDSDEANNATSLHVSALAIVRVGCPPRLAE